MRRVLPRPHLLAVGLSAALASSVAMAQQVIADGDEQNPAAGDYHTTDPVEPGNPGGHAFLAINGGSLIPTGPVNLITEGLRAAAARAEGAGSRIELQAGSVLTSGYGAAGLSAANGGQVHASGTHIETRGTAASGAEALSGALSLDNVRITTRGGLAHGISVQQGQAVVRDSAIEILGDQSNGVDVRDGTLLAERLQIAVAGAGHGVWAQGGSDVTLRSARIDGSGAGASGVLVGLGSKVVLEDVDIDLTHERSGMGLFVGGELEMRGGSVHARGDNATAVSFATGGGGVLRLDGVELSGHFGIHMTEGADLTLHGSRLDSVSIGIDMNQRDVVASVTDSFITTRNGVGIRVTNGDLVVDGSTITANGTYWQAISVLGGTAQVTGSRLRTLGQNGHGLYAEGGVSAAPIANGNMIDILTEGDGAIGAIARLGGTVHLADSVVRTTGINSHGVLSGGRGEMTLANTHVRTEGEGAWAAVINDNGRMSIDGGSLASARHGGVWVRSSRDAGLALGNGAVLVGGNGTALALDAAVSGRFDVALSQGAVMEGDIVITPEDVDAGLVPQSQVHVALRDGAQWWGSSDLVQTLSLEQGSQWTLRGDARVGTLDVRDSAVLLSAGLGDRFNTLTVDGDLHSTGATFVFHGTLAADDSAIDRLHVRGDTSGDALIAVRNIGGVGAPTVDGIQLIEVDGASLASYALTGRAVGGSYEYFLFQGGLADPSDGHWYLRSQWFDVCEDDPGAPGCAVNPGPGPDPIEGGEGEDGGGIVDPIRPPPVLRPEAGAYLANQSAAVNMFAHRMHDRTGTLTGERTAWARVGRSNADFTAVGGQLSVDGNTSVLQIGSDLLRKGNAAFGVMLGNGRADNRVVSDLTGYTATGRVRGNAVGVYGTWVQDEDGTAGAYVDANVQSGRFDNRVQGIGLEPEHYDSRVATASLEVGHTFNVWQGAGSALYVQPQLQLTYADYRADRHVETNGTVVDDADVGGLSGRLGMRVFGHGAAAGTIVQPYLGVNWLRGSGTSTLQFNGDTLGADVPRNRYEVQAGAELKLGQRWGAWGGLSAQRGDHGYRNVGGQVGVRMAW
ncbi:MAG: autotransporter outer membrane beta-barrel domain-containing protein [Stenotrophomonas sp.]